MIRLLVTGWCEPPHLGGLHLSTLVHQILALISQCGGVSASRAYAVLCHDGPFRAVQPKLFLEVLRSIGAPEVKLIEQSPDGTLLPGDLGERIIDSHDFYAVFQTPEEYRIVCDGKDLGTLPIVTVIVPGMTIIFSGRRWEVVEVQDEARVITVIPAGAGVPPLFGGEAGDLHETVATEMHRIYKSDEMPPFLDATARDLLDEARHAFLEFGLTRTAMVEFDGDSFLFPWSGTIACSTLMLALKQAGLPASTRGIIIEIERTRLDRIRETLGSLAKNADPDPIQLASQVANLVHEKYDRFLPRHLQTIGFAADRLSPEAVPRLARLLLGE